MITTIEHQTLTGVVNGYQLMGNFYVAIAISSTDPKDAHYFTPREADQYTGEDGASAWDIAVAWASLGI